MPKIKLHFSHRKFLIYTHIKYNKYKKVLFGVGIYYLLTLFLIYPISPCLFSVFLRFKEPVFVSPIAAEEIHIRSDRYGDGHFGTRRGGGRRKHKGLDIRADMGEPVYASKSGVTATGWVKGGMGKYVKIKHQGGYVTLYGHLSEITVNSGAWVWQNEEIGKAGKTGNANYRAMHTHVHFEIRQNGKHIDPLPEIVKKR